MQHCGNCGNAIPTRLTIGIMIFTACFVSYLLRVNMSINLIGMVSHKDSGGNEAVPECVAKTGQKNFSYTSGDGYKAKIESKSKKKDVVRYDWDQKVQGIILSSYFWGYTITQVPGGMLAERFGTRKCITVSALLSGLSTLLIPLAASAHWGVVVFLRIVLGFVAGVLYPALHTLVAHWAPPAEKGKFSSSLLGGTLGTVITWPVMGLVMEVLNWKWAFYLSGAFALFWCIFWCYFVHDKPELHPRITEEEKEYIIASLGDRLTEKKLVPPYAKIFTSVPFWALAFLHTGNTWGLYLLLTAGPKYMSEVLGFNLSKSGMLASLPYIARMISGFVFGYINDLIRKKALMPKTKARKFFVLFSHIIPGLLMYCVILTGCNAGGSVTLITLCMTFNGAVTVTNFINPHDLAPNYAGSVYALINTIGSVSGFITPLVTGHITQDNNGLREWGIIYGIGGTIYIVSGICFIVFGTAYIQPWNFIDPENSPQRAIEVALGNPAFIKMNK